MKIDPNADFNDKLFCHWNTDIECKSGYSRNDCEFQPADDDKPHGKDEPKELLWRLTYDDSFEPVCPSCGEMPYSLDRCIFCGQKLISKRELPPPEIIGAHPADDSEDAPYLCDKCGANIDNEGLTLVAHTDAVDYFSWEYTCDKCGNEIIYKKKR